MIHLVLGGARSGKSRFAENWVTQLTASIPQVCPPVYIATATIGNDDEMANRIARHQSDRNTSALAWVTLETPLALADCLTQIDKANQVILVDCLTLYLTNHLLRSSFGGVTQTLIPHLETDVISVDWQTEKAQLLAVLPTLKSHVVLVSNEVGSGIVPMGELSREFVDQAGWLNQAIAALADEVSLVVAGLPLRLKIAPNS
ncbi:bifunctional adenosylcobinamide kinase/adenosylcobinamide-phosphate guanylyltransferase [Shewanella subflava]|uniref:Bifunctional adenosylcobalamin biosynthesis protein n=1 Tax=Shewanella subflava TaxID=2986476 RepID=A0ABT3IB04_9GAMM|nr:bifunctional adenosylcobinamide kinase/adenosylcobinamide-phosphate guanylyltransferase [Shewanella subflava]MCW3173218.1 bifunctional adenosylcobinamide kinase/adenosylcobinamide-phosphate guanylyltransferase [Shewanella subflava]